MDDRIEKKESKIIEVHEELIEILESLRGRVSDFSYGALNESLGWKDLTLLLAKKIKLRHRIV